MDEKQTLVDQLKWASKIAQMKLTAKDGGDEFVRVLSAAAARIGELEAENAALQSEKDQLQDRADAYDVLQWLIGEGYHDFRWDYNSDTEILSLESSGLSVELSLHELKHDSTMMTLRMLKAIAAKDNAQR